VGAVLIGVFFRSSGTAASPPGNRWIAALGTVALLVVVFSGLVLCSTELQNRAQGEYDSMKPKEAIETLRLARRIMPFDSSLFHDAGQIQLELSQKLHDSNYLADAKESFTRAIELSPNKVGPHVGLGLCLSAEHDVVGGLKEIRLAQYLYPDSTNTQAIVRLMEKNLASAP
jgi:tetratricopeptide (TPR) repeat protein